jgi:hypothetical protein
LVDGYISTFSANWSLVDIRDCLEVMLFSLFGIEEGPASAWFVICNDIIIYRVGYNEIVEKPETGNRLLIEFFFSPLQVFSRSLGCLDRKKKKYQKYSACIYMKQTKLDQKHTSEMSLISSKIR